jgi:hypothetical protein
LPFNLRAGSADEYGDAATAIQSRRQRMGYASRLRLAAILGAVAMVVACLAPSAASAASYAGSFPDGGALSFKTVTRNGKIVRVKGFAWSDVPVTCKQGDFTYTSTLPYSLRVSSRLFSATAYDVGLVESVSGRFTNKGRKANGTLRVYGTLGLGQTNCSTGKIAWSAVRR